MLELCTLHVDGFVRHGTCHSPQHKLSDDTMHSGVSQSKMEDSTPKLCAQTAGLCDDLYITFAITYLFYSNHFSNLRELFQDIEYSQSVQTILVLFLALPDPILNDHKKVIPFTS